MAGECALAEKRIESVLWRIRTASQRIGEGLRVDSLGEIDSPVVTVRVG